MQNSEIKKEIPACHEGTRVITVDKTVTLYHGSKSGISGAIVPVSCEKCDFGKGFYNGGRNLPKISSGRMIL